MEKEEDDVDDIEVVGEEEELKVPRPSDKGKGENKDDYHDKEKTNASRVGNATNEAKQTWMKGQHPLGVRIPLMAFRANLTEPLGEVTILVHNVFI